ncbi:MAG TPA: hypothetical protein VMB82_06715, partial [Acidimicrobiales bacterium]|nr:hypothetical protein [Acidimicrobiales bacterium]
MAGRAERAVARRAGATMVVLALTGAVGAAAPPAAAAGWTVVLGATSSGGALGGTAPVPPAGVTASCSSLLSGAAQVEWDGVPGATSFGIYESTQSATAGYALVATGVTGTS